MGEPESSGSPICSSPSSPVSASSWSPSSQSCPCPFCTGSSCSWAFLPSAVFSSLTGSCFCSCQPSTSPTISTSNMFVCQGSTYSPLSRSSASAFSTSSSRTPQRESPSH